jgi:DNA-binding transcriptional MerR regulator|tara:strand:+ start:1008 stop:1190 length:183 start_codon:yes stop_codon:yes gene_type:complete
MVHSAYDTSKVRLIKHLQALGMSDEELQEIVLLASEMAEAKRIDYKNAVNKLDASFRRVR